MEEKKYLIYKISGGLCHMLGQINRAIHLSKITKRNLIIDCFGHTFHNDFNKYFNIPNFTYTTNYNCLYQEESLNKEMFELYINVEAKYTGINTYFLKDKLISVNASNVLNSNEKIIYCSW